MPKYVVNTPLKHNGQRCNVDDTVDMPADEAVDLLARGMIAPAPAEEAVAAQADATPARGRKVVGRR